MGERKRKTVKEREREREKDEESMRIGKGMKSPGKNRCAEIVCLIQ